jgi:hypothetical protein
VRFRHYDFSRPAHTGHQGDSIAVFAMVDDF